MCINIRLAHPDDAYTMAEILMKSWEVTYKDIIPMDFIIKKNSTRHELFKQVITKENRDSYVIDYNGKTVGILKVAEPKDEDLNDDFYEVHYIYLHPDYYRMGIGSKAMDFAFTVARKLDKKLITIWVLADNMNAINFYNKCGFLTDDKTKEVEYGKAIKCIRMRKSL